MGRLIDVVWPELGHTIVAELADEDNPELTEDFWRHLPFKALCVHPVAGGEIVYCWAPIVTTAPAQRKDCGVNAPVGQMRYSGPGGNKFSFQYGEGYESGLSPVLGNVLPEHLSVLPAIGQQIWENLFWRKDTLFMEIRPHDPSKAYAGRSEYDDLAGPAAEFYAEAKRIELSEPDELRRIRLGQVGNTGSYGQYFSAWQMTHSKLHGYIVTTMYPLLRLLPDLEIAAFRRVFDELNSANGGYLGYLGLKTLERFSKELVAIVHGTEDKREVASAIKAFLMYGYRLCAWSYLYFPWYLGMFYGRRENGQEFPGRIPHVGRIPSN